MIDAMARWWRGLRYGNGSQRPGRYCPVGHPMDPNWDTCPRCAAEQRAREKTVLEPTAAGTDANCTDANQAARTTMIRRPTSISDNEPAPGQHAGRAPSPLDVPAQVVARGHERKITGVLATFSWRPQGQLFALYEGRNVIGSGQVESEDGRDCDIRIEEDRMLSNEHAVILCRNGRYDLVDRHSTNGTYMNGAFVEAQGVPLADGAWVGTGATVWTFRKIDDGRPPPASAPTGPVAPHEPDTKFTPG